MGGRWVECTLTPIATDTTTSPELQEQQYVHEVYDQIAPHFSQTRYKPWPIISKFLASLSPGSIGLDSGTGNGKYLPLDQDGTLLTVGLDRSLALLRIAQTAGGGEDIRREVVRSDALVHCWRDAAFNYAISIATIHHLSTPLRRRQAVQALLRAVRSNGGRILIYVWAVEQDPLSKRVIPETNHASATSVETTGPGSSGSKAALKEQDLLVPWLVNPPPAPAATTQKPSRRQRKHAKEVTAVAVSAGPEDSMGLSSLQPGALETKVFQRYYHFFEADELHNLVCEAAAFMELQIGSPPHRDQDYSLSVGSTKTTKGVEIVNEGWERSNLYIELRLWES
ncbi:tRNA methyltransferase, has a role in tRNA modification [Tulasnella sp. JGI-2019a]|nr:tRNA methyltransferase, has a role in tRNA modification [Tulasnella sp. JGI-2019a]